jgi:transcriptional regulator GlxA family with amidase domain
MDSDLKNMELKKWVTSTATKAHYVVTLCDGAFILANTGLLNGKKATTFPSDIAAFRKLFPQVQTQEGYSFVHDGKFLTSQGGARSYDVALYLIDLLYGEKVAAGVGRGLVLPWPQPDLEYLK